MARLGHVLSLSSINHSYLTFPLVNSARKFSPSVPAGNTEWKRETNVDPIITDSSKASKVLGVTYIPLDQTTKDILADFEQRGWWKS